MIDSEDETQLRIIQKAAHTVGDCNDWFDHGGGERAKKMIRDQVPIVQAACAALSAEVRGRLPGELFDRFAQFPENGWHSLEDAAIALLPPAD